MRYLELVLDVDQPTSTESCRWNVWNVNGIVPDCDVVLVCRSFLQSRQLLSFLFSPLARFVVDHLQTEHRLYWLAWANGTAVHSAGGSRRCPVQGARTPALCLGCHFLKEHIILWKFILMSFTPKICRTFLYSRQDVIDTMFWMLNCCKKSAISNFHYLFLQTEAYCKNRI